MVALQRAEVALRVKLLVYLFCTPLSESDAADTSAVASLPAVGHVVSSCALCLLREPATRRSKPSG